MVVNVCCVGSFGSLAGGYLLNQLDEIAAQYERGTAGVSSETAAVVTEFYKQGRRGVCVPNFLFVDKDTAFGRQIIDVKAVDSSADSANLSVDENTVPSRSDRFDVHPYQTYLQDRTQGFEMKSLMTNEEVKGFSDIVNSVLDDKCCAKVTIGDYEDTNLAPLVSLEDTTDTVFTGQVEDRLRLQLEDTERPDNFVVFATTSDMFASLSLQVLNYLTEETPRAAILNVFGPGRDDTFTNRGEADDGLKRAMHVSYVDSVTDEFRNKLGKAVIPIGLCAHVKTNSDRPNLSFPSGVTVCESNDFLVSAAIAGLLIGEISLPIGMRRSSYYRAPHALYSSLTFSGSSVINAALDLDGWDNSLDANKDYKRALQEPRPLFDVSHIHVRVNKSIYFEKTAGTMKRRFHHSVSRCVGKELKLDDSDTCVQDMLPMPVPFPYKNSKAQHQTSPPSWLGTSCVFASPISTGSTEYDQIAEISDWQFGGWPSSSNSMTLFEDAFDVCKLVNAGQISLERN